jgi:hypothetical protein
MQSLSQRELRKLGVMMENFMAGFLTVKGFFGKPTYLTGLKIHDLYHVAGS